MAEVIEQAGQTLESTTVGIFRTASVVKGGRRFSFAALVVVGDRQGSVGIGYGKAPGVPAAIEKAQKDARKNVFKVHLKGGTLPHPVTGRFLSSKVRLLPAAPGTGVIAGGTVRAVLEMAGVQDCLTKAYGSTNKKNLTKAVIEGLRDLRLRDEIADMRGVTIEKSTVDEMLEAGQVAALQAEAKAKVAAERIQASLAEQKAADEAAAAAAPKVEEPKAEEAPAEEAKAEEAPAEEAKPEGEAQAEAPAEEAKAEEPQSEEEPKKDGE
ncbi:30S ribosomal protein S5 [Mucisphaera calidilacus]|uniref:Small ribosomal subunit protein uS5 n=1 Tax=Mucisphaera calidilacus TaxID=2527982 RepID=A0A518BXQ2_9BACT|nr:30S ribosomal protein S5 [Mucisphaera calidilacus]